jgi:hypothetical protein
MNNTTLVVIVLLLLAAALIVLFRRKSPNEPATDQWVMDQPDLPQPKIQPSDLQQPLIQKPGIQPPAIQSPAIQPPAIQPPAIQTPVDESDTDQKVLDQLREAGSDLNKPHQMEFILYFPTEESARSVANRIRAEGFSVEVKRAPQGSPWLCVAMKRMVPKRAEIAAIGKRFKAIAQEFNGEYDGWETSLEK